MTTIDLEYEDFEDPRDYFKYLDARFAQTWVRQPDGRWGLMSVYNGEIKDYTEYREGFRPEDPQHFTLHCYPEEPGGPIVCHTGGLD